jgi:hypothetical protein
MAAEGGRGPSGVPVTVWAFRSIWIGCGRRDPARVVVSLNSAPAGEIPPVLDRWAELIGSTQQR